MSFSEADIKQAAQGICAEHCAHMGEPPCWRVTDDKGELMTWPPESCDDPGCIWLAKAALAALKKS